VIIIIILDIINNNTARVYTTIRDYSVQRRRRHTQFRVFVLWTDLCIHRVPLRLPLIHEGVARGLVEYSFISYSEHFFERIDKKSFRIHNVFEYFRKNTFRIRIFEWYKKCSNTLQKYLSAYSFYFLFITPTSQAIFLF